MSREDDAEERYKDLVAACWNVFANEHAAAARISIMFEVYPELAMRKLREDPEFFGPLRRQNINTLHRDDAAFDSTALIIRERVREFRDVVEETAEAEKELEREQERQRRRRRERERGR